MNWPEALKWTAIGSTFVMCGTYVFLLSVPQQSPDASWIFYVHLGAIPIAILASLLALRTYPVVAMVCLAISANFAVVQFLG